MGARDIKDVLATHYSERTPAEERIAAAAGEEREALRQARVATRAGQILNDADYHGDLMATLNESPEGQACTLALRRITPETAVAAIKNFRTQLAEIALMIAESEYPK